MDHFKIVNTEEEESCLMFSHFTMEASPGEWRRENKISLNRIKINVFLEGEFSVFAEGRVWRPTWGDVCVFPPETVHCGQISKHVHLDYYELDVGIRALDGIPEGRALLEALNAAAREQDYIIKPGKEASLRRIALCASVEDAVREGDMPLAFVRTVELLSCMKELFQSSHSAASCALSRVTGAAVCHLEAHYDEPLTLAALSDLLGVSSSYLSRVFKREVGMGVHEYLLRYRALRASYLLKEERSVASVGYACGFSDSSHFISVFKKLYGITPADYQKCRR